MSEMAIKITGSDVERFAQLRSLAGLPHQSHDDNKKELYRLVRNMELVYQPIKHEDMNEYWKSNGQRASTTIQ